MVRQKSHGVKVLAIERREGTRVIDDLAALHCARRLPIVSQRAQKRLSAGGASHRNENAASPYNAWGDQTDIARNASINDPCFYYPPHQHYAYTEKRMDYL
jgi:hypothetical protein